jgi:hypothetical protein
MFQLVYDGNGFHYHQKLQDRSINCGFHYHKKLQAQQDWIINRLTYFSAF